MHEAWDWIWPQHQSQLIYRVLHPCQLLESKCEQYSKAKEKGQANLPSLSAATSSVCSIHLDALTALCKHAKCGYCHSPSKCPAYGKECFNCSGQNHFTALCRRSRRLHHPSHNTSARSHWPTGRSNRQRAGPSPDATIPVAGTDPTTHLADTPTCPKAIALPTDLPLDVPVDPQEDTGDPPPPGNTKIVLSCPCIFPNQQC